MGGSDEHPLEIVTDDKVSASPLRSPPKSPSSPSARRVTVQELTLQLQQLVDDWHFGIVHTRLAKRWDRQKVLRALFDVLEINGVDFEGGAKDKLLCMEERSMVGELVELIPDEVRDNFMYITGCLMKAVRDTADVRRTIDEGSPDAVSELLGGDTDESVNLTFLTRAVHHGCEEAVKVRKRAEDWRKSSDNRLQRLRASKEGAEDAERALLRVEAELAEFGQSSKADAKKAVNGIAAKNSKALVNSTFNGWLDTVKKGVAQKHLRAQLEQHIANLERKLYEAKERQLTGVKKAILKSHGDAAGGLMTMCMKAWIKEIEILKKEGDTANKVREAKDKLANMQQMGKDNAQQVMTRITTGNNSALVNLCLQSWQKFIEDYRKNKDYEDAVKKSEKALQDHLAAKKEETKGVLDRMSASSDAGLLGLVVQNWSAYVIESKGDRERSDQLMQGQTRFKSLQDKQLGNVRGVQGRVNEMIATILTMRSFQGWIKEAKNQRVSSHFENKMKSKRKQLESVQQLFGSFAQQLEQGLKDEDDSESRPPSASKPGRGGRGHSSRSGSRAGSRASSRPGSGMRGSESAPILPSVV